MISAFTILFLAALVSISLHRSVLLKPFVLVSLIVAAFYTYSGAGLPLIGFSTTKSVHLFELILELILFAFVLHEDNEHTLTQILFIGAASILLLYSETVLSFILSFEAISLISVVLVSYIQTKEQAEGGVKLFIAGGIASGILFLGLSFYVLGGGFLLEPLSSDTSSFATMGVFIMLIALFYKLTIVPFHGWALDTYALVRHSHAALLSGVIKTVVALAVFRTFSPFLLEHLVFSTPLLVGLALITMTLGNFLALFRKNLAQVLTYSSIAHAGYILLAFVSVQSSYASTAILYISIAYIFMQSAAFLVVDLLRRHYKIRTIDELSGFSKQNSLLSFFFTLQLFSLAGIPLLAGFLAKAVLFYALVDVDLWWVALIALLNSALSVGYYAWIVKGIYFDELTAKKVMFAPIQLPLVGQVVLAMGTIYFGIFAGVVFY